MTVAPTTLAAFFLDKFKIILKDLRIRKIRVKVWVWGEWVLLPAPTIHTLILLIFKPLRIILNLSTKKAKR
jgi:hypothetical protein